MSTTILPREYCCSLKLLDSTVRYGSVGLGGDLGYENSRVVVRQTEYEQAVSAHGPSRLVYQIDRRFDIFRAQVAINDDVDDGLASADFFVYADNRLAGAAFGVESGAGPRVIEADIRTADRLELRVETSDWHCCHSVWLDPVCLASSSADVVDCFGQSTVSGGKIRISARRCIATITTPDFLPQLENLLGSLQANGDVTDAAIVVFSAGADDAVRDLVARFGAVTVPFQLESPASISMKSLLYSVARLVDADEFICLDADTTVTGSISPLFGALQTHHPRSVLVCREGNHSRFGSLGEALTSMYGGHPSELPRITGNENGREGAYPLVVNDGVFAGTRAALLSLDGMLRTWERGRDWMTHRPEYRYRNQFLFNLALAHTSAGVEIADVYNLQMHVQEVDVTENGHLPQVRWNGQDVRILHFNGRGRTKLESFQSRFRTQNPLVATSAPDNYARFLQSLRKWVAEHGLKILAWSFYGTSDGRNARVADAGTFPLLAALHYLIRSNGCERVLECGTAKGVSAACLASAVAHRTHGRVVSFDPGPHPERHSLWSLLPDDMSLCIEQRETDSVSGMLEALNRHEKYDAALIDSLHTRDQVLKEFALATRLVCRGGLILIHDSVYQHGNVSEALDVIEKAGYSATRLWEAESGVREDDQLGLAVIDNRLGAFPLPNWLQIPGISSQ